MRKRFLVSVGDVVAMKGNDVIFTAKTLVDSGITVETSNTEIRGGQGNQLQAVYYHTGTFNIAFTDTQFRLQYIASNTGSKIVTGGDILANETVALQGKKGTLSGIPVKIANQELAVWAEYDGVHYTLPVTVVGDTYTFTVDNTAIPEDSTLCVMYMNNKSAAQSITIPANIIPDRVRLYITATLYGDTSGSGKVGTVQIEVPVAQLSGSQEITMTADGYSKTPLTAMAIAYSDNTAGCSSGAYYAKITEYLEDSVWYSGVSALAIDGGDFSIAKNGSTTLKVWAVGNGVSFPCDNANLTFSSSETNTAAIGPHTGVVLPVAAGTTTLKVYITGKSDIEASCTLTVIDEGE